ncbi:MAG TPA: bifunctional diaminohydroxyphosphoribosylaminopyrimidine deaminase/5-amino-6-(5-phosphoribosylamino)uracil reductase RibD [Acidimicrobiales bacterium]|nr:bifunctional diaminohydroxyphosphoribosylaminopyrimidine deaminase/5-amino-6-(5-phosphoribosylamino)uracil reductase RibD [Acidimicrobiales bacterium]
MYEALAAGHAVRRDTAPNPWVGCVIETVDGARVTGATSPPPGAHAEAAALEAARRQGLELRGATVWVTLEPCSHEGRTAPCADALIDAEVSRVVVALEDPDPRVAGEGLKRLRAAGVDVTVGVLGAQVSEDLAPYLKHRRTARPWVTLKLAASLDGRTAAADGTSQWITGVLARADAHRLRAEHDAVLVGAGTVRDDDPALTVRHAVGTDPLRVVLGTAPSDARIHPCIELRGDLDEVLANLASRGVLSVLVEGGSKVAGAFHDAGLVDRYVIYLAPAVLGASGRALFAGTGPHTLADAWRGEFLDVAMVGEDVRVTIAPHRGD